MPRYSYNCSECNETFQVSHGMSETLLKCELCGSLNCLKKVYGNVTVKTKTRESVKAAERVGEFIKDSKEVLESQKSESRRKLDD